MDIQNKVVIITGASMGIGAATARVFAERGAKVVLAARSTDKLTAVAKSLTPQAEALVVPTDMTDRTQVNALADAALTRFGRIDIVINNAGQSAIGPLETIKTDVYRRLVELNLFGPLYMMQAVIPSMRTQEDGGVIINVSSLVSKMALTGLGAYSSTKYALNGLSLIAHNELAADNIRVVLFYPWTTDTELVKNGLSDEAEAANVLRSNNWLDGPTREPDSPEDVAYRLVEAAINEPVEMEMSARDEHTDR